MDSPSPENGKQSGEAIIYLHHMLGELRQVARAEGADLLSYLIEMAYIEAGDILSGRQDASVTHGKRNKSSRMPM
ncbi:hypothetical protein [Ciceribacter sp. L1K22]|uniref:hypothetical protein n=1 Tax=Ciceribacter sp. L1K22 TaxID=2820275 RepID=UPI001ABE3DF3|nr:hypothetical protein [Ciceribacter sp. L1K22]MBO3759859.1 hypothetical protein [Ciceribacter sp. L1K22]